MELWDLYNENRELTGRDHIRGEEVPQGQIAEYIKNQQKEDKMGEQLECRRLARSRGASNSPGAAGGPHYVLRQE